MFGHALSGRAVWREDQLMYCTAKVGTHDALAQRCRENNLNRLTNTLFIRCYRETFFAVVPRDRELPSFSQKLGHLVAPCLSADQDGSFTFNDLVGRAYRFQDCVAHAACL